MANASGIDEAGLYWAPSKELIWTPAEVTRQSSTQVTLKDVFSGETYVFAVSDVQKFVTLTRDSLEKDVGNLNDLEEISEAATMYHIRKRFLENEIYTNVGPILVAVNPYQRLPIYSPELLLTYGVPRDNPEARETGKYEPHPFTVAHEAYRRVLDDHINQSILISGESGAGKTETTKRILSFFSAASRADTSGAAGGPKVIGLEEMLLKTNPITEAFGNAKTLRNDNSSRFGKFMEVGFTGIGDICNVVIINYLLEKSRVSQQPGGERNYHAFYMLCRGADDALRQALVLPPEGGDADGGIMTFE